MAEKDATEKRLEDYADVFADIVNVLLFNGKRLIDPKDLITEVARSTYNAENKIHEQERDVAKYWQKGKIRIAFVGLENQTNVDYDMVFRIIGYDGATYRDQLNKDVKGKPKERYPVITIVLYFGYEDRWTPSLHLKDYFHIPKELEPYFNDYKINLFEIAWLPDEIIQKFESDFKFVADYFSQMRKNNDYIPEAKSIKHVEALLNLFSALTKDKRFIEVYNEKMKGDVYTMSPFLDKIENRGFDRGHAAGVDEGMKQGFNQGMKQGASKLGRLMKSLLKDTEKEEIESLIDEALNNPEKLQELYNQHNIQ